MKRTTIKFDDINIISVYYCREMRVRGEIQRGGGK